VDLQGGPKSKPLPNYQKVVLNRIKACQFIGLIKVSIKHCVLSASFAVIVLCPVLYTNFFNFHFSYSLFLVFNLDFIIYIDFTRIAASNTANDDVTN